MIEDLVEDDKRIIKKGLQARQVRIEQFNQHLKEQGYQLPPSMTNKPTIVMDLDHTLIQPSETMFKGWQHKIPVLVNQQIKQIQFKVRPFVKEFLNQCSKYYEIIVFSAAIPEFAELVIEIIDQDLKIDQRLQRQSCSQYKDSLMYKDLARLGRNLSKTVLIDDSMFNYIAQPFNGLPISKQLGEENDQYLQLLIDFLLNQLYLQDDQRSILKQQKSSNKEIMYIHENPIFQQNELIKFINIQKLNYASIGNMNKNISLNKINQKICEI